MKKIVRLTESDLTRIVKRVIRENQMDMFSDNKYESKIQNFKNKIRTIHSYDEFVELHHKVLGLEKEIQNDSQLDQNEKDYYLNQWDELLDHSMKKVVALSGQKTGDYDYYEGDLYGKNTNGNWLNKKGRPGNYEFNDDEFEDEEYGPDQFDDFVDKYGVETASRWYGSDPKNYFKTLTSKKPLQVKRRK
jgi:hypothetical protein